jgi:hypothetical protein
MQKIAKMTVAVASSLSIAAAGLTGLAGASSITETGPDSWNKVKSSNEFKTEVKNKNDVRVDNDNDQNAKSGDVKVKHNTTGGDATSGAAANENGFTADLTVENGGAWGMDCGCTSSTGGDDEITNTGPDSNNVIESKNKVTVKVTNDNKINVKNDNNQVAKSGKVEVSGNTTGGDATSGDASNTNDTHVTLSISN